MSGRDDPTPEDIARVHAFEQRQREEGAARSRAKSEQRAADALRLLTERLVGQSIVSIETATEVEFSGPGDRWAETYGLTLTFADGGRVEFEGEYESSAITITFLSA